MAVSSKMSIDSKPKPLHRAESEESAVSSSPERDHNALAPATSINQEPAQPKRKGGRKPIYATSEERKQRNRQAQAAFRERRTEYIKQLEETIQVHEANLHSLQSAHRNAADECLMLRYKNSLLERVLLEKGIDVQAELQTKTASPALGTANIVHSMMQPAPIHSPMMNRSRKSASAFTLKMEVGNAAMSAIKPEASPKIHTTPSPSNTSSAFSPITGNAALKAGTGDDSRSQMPAAVMKASGQPLMDRRSGSAVSSTGASFYPTSAFHNHLDHLDHDFDQGDMIDSELDGPNTDPFPCFSGNDSIMVSLDSAAPNHQISGTGPGFPSMSQLLGQNLDWDPFGLSASMNFPAQQFQFEQSAPIR